jgi:hypothetical protein
MELTFSCPHCGTVGIVASVESTPTVTCRGCSRGHPLRSDAFEGGGLRSCAWCATDDLYVQKDFPQGLGLLIVIVGFAISTVFWYLERPIPAYVVLLASALLDMILYYRVPDVTICYRCLGQYRGVRSNIEGRFKPFDLAIGERYRQERLRAEQLRKQGASANSPPPA